MNKIAQKKVELEVIEQLLRRLDSIQNDVDCGCFYTEVYNVEQSEILDYAGKVLEQWRSRIEKEI